MTNRQKNRIKIIGKNRTKKQELLDSGYALSTAIKQPPSVMKAIGFEEGLEKYLPNDKIFIVHEEGLGATKIHGTNDNFIEIVDYPTRLKAAELAYKIKGKLKDGVNVQGDLNMSVTIIRHAE